MDRIWISPKQYQLHNMKVGASILAFLSFLTQVSISTLEALAQQQNVGKRGKCKLNAASFAFTWVALVFICWIAKLEAHLSKEKWFSTLINWRKITILITAVLLPLASTVKYFIECVGEKKRYAMPFLIVIAAVQCGVNFYDLIDNKQTHCSGCNCKPKDGIEDQAGTTNEGSCPSNEGSSSSEGTLEHENKETLPHPLKVERELDAVQANTSMSYMGSPNASSLSPPSSPLLPTYTNIPSHYTCVPTAGSKSSGALDSPNLDPHESSVGASAAIQLRPEPLQAASTDLCPSDEGSSSNEGPLELVKKGMQSQPLKAESIGGEVTAVQANLSMSYIGSPNASSVPALSFPLLPHQAIIPSHHTCVPTAAPKSSRALDLLDPDPHESSVGASAAIQSQPQPLQAVSTDLCPWNEGSSSNDGHLELENKDTQPQPLRAASIGGEVAAVQAKPSMSCIGPTNTVSLPPPSSPLPSQPNIPSHYAWLPSAGPKSNGALDLLDPDPQESSVGASAAIHSVRI